MTATKQNSDAVVDECCPQYIPQTPIVQFPHLKHNNYMLEQSLSVHLFSSACSRVGSQGHQGVLRPAKRHSPSSVFWVFLRVLSQSDMPWKPSWEASRDILTSHPNHLKRLIDVEEEKHYSESQMDNWISHISQLACGKKSFQPYTSTSLLFWSLPRVCDHRYSQVGP